MLVQLYLAIIPKAPVLLQGKGIIVSDMSFMEDVTSICETCHGTRYKEEVLHYLYNGKISLKY